MPRPITTIEEDAHQFAWHYSPRADDEERQPHRRRERPARDSGTFAESTQLGPHHRGMHPAAERSLREAAIGAGNHVLIADQSRQAGQPLGDKLRMLNHVRRVADDAGQ
jgi:hypothetical protein